MKIPAPYEWLGREDSPQILVEALKLYGTKEIVGEKHNPKILNWAKEIGGWVADFYKADEIPWCGLFVGICAHRAGFPFTQKLLSAKAWQEWGNASAVAKLGDVLVFNREGGGHVGLYVGEDAIAYHVLGGNQGNQVCVTRIDKKRCVAIRQCAWKIARPSKVRRVFLDAKGVLSTNEG